MPNMLRWAVGIAVAVAAGVAGGLVVALIEPVAALASAFGLSPATIGVGIAALALLRFYLLEGFRPHGAAGD